MKTKISELAENKSILENNFIANADNTWKDAMKEKFFSEHIMPVRSEYSTFFGTMEETAHIFEEAERTIRSLM